MESNGPQKLNKWQKKKLKKQKMLLKLANARAKIKKQPPTTPKNRDST